MRTLHKKERLKMAGFTKQDAGMFNQRSVFQLKLDDKVLDIPIISLSSNINDIISEELPYPQPPKKFIKATKSFSCNYEDEEYLEQKAKIDRLRTYAMVIHGIDQAQFPIEGNTLYEKIDTLIGTGIPIGFFAQIADAIGELSGISRAEFR